MKVLISPDKTKAYDVIHYEHDIDPECPELVSSIRVRVLESTNETYRRPLREFSLEFDTSEYENIDLSHIHELMLRRDEFTEHIEEQEPVDSGEVTL